VVSVGGEAGPVACWFAQGEATIPPGLDWLSVRERARLDQLRFTKRRTEFLLRRWAGKYAVARSVGRPMHSSSTSRIELLNHPTGAPYVELDGRPADLDVSLSDRAGTAVALVGPRGSGPGTLGIDLEVVEPRTEGFVSDFLTESEAAWVHGRRLSAGEDGWQEAANLIWSAKEAALKVLRVGLRADTRSVEVCVGDQRRDDGWAPMNVTSVRGEVFPGWWRRDGVFILSIAYAPDSSFRDPPLLGLGGTDLVSAVPLHSWMRRPTVI
jgi:4'-phosphopantetheinyl transferase